MEIDVMGVVFVLGKVVIGKACLEQSAPVVCVVEWNVAEKIDESNELACSRKS